MTDDPIEHTKQVHAGNPAVMALMAEVEHGRQRRQRRPEAPRPAERVHQPSPALTDDTEGVYWCIGCQRMVPCATWPEHQPHHPLQMPSSAKPA